MIFQADFVTHVSEPTNSEIFDDQEPSEVITYFVDPEVCPVRPSSTLYIAHYPDTLEPRTGPVKMLTVIHVGSEEAPDVSRYAETCTTLEFRGHISSVNGVFGIVEQLPNLKTLSISIGDLQELYEPDDSRDITVCPSVRELQILIDQKYYNSFLHSDCGKRKKRSADCAAGICMSAMQHSIAWLAKSLLISSLGTFPNLERLKVDLLNNGFLDQIVSCLIQCCPIIKNKKLEETRPETAQAEIAQAEIAQAGRILQNPIGAKRAKAPLFISF